MSNASAITSRAAAQRLPRAYPPNLIAPAAVILIVTLIPYLCGYMLAPQGKSFLGALNNTGDLSQYLAAIRQGAQGAWRYTNQFSPDHARKLIMYTPYLVMGHFSLGLPVAVSFQILRLLTGALLLYAIARFCRLFVGQFALRACWLFVILAGGLYWLALPLSAVVSSIDPTVLTAPELNPLTTLLNSPHESLGLAAEIMGFLCVLRASGAPEPLWSVTRQRVPASGSRTRYLWGAAGWFLILALSYPFLLPTIGCVLVAYVVVAARSAWAGRLAAAAPKRRLRAGEVFATEMQAVVIGLVPAGLLGLYYVGIFHGDPHWSHSGLAQIGRPDLSTLLFAYAPLALAAYAGARVLRALRQAGGDAVPAAWAWFPAIWGLTNLGTLMLPVWQQGRQELGLSVPLALLAFLWLAGSRVATEGFHSLPAIPAAALAFSAPFLIALYTAVTADGVSKDYYVPTGVSQAVEWLGNHASDTDVVLASARFGNLVPERCACQVVIGQNFETFDFQRRQAEVHRFYQAPSLAVGTKRLAQLAAREHVTLVVYSPLESEFGHVLQPARIPGYSVAYARHGVLIFSRVDPHA